MSAAPKNRMDNALQRLQTTIAASRFSTVVAVRVAYATDSSQRNFVPDVVVWPESAAEVAQVIAIANEGPVPVYVRGRGSATTGASLAEQGGILMSTERMDKIIAIDTATRTATVEPGVINADLNQTLQKYGLFWPPDPSSRAYCTIGGNLATAAAGPTGVKYGGVRENVLAIEAVCGSGATIACGAKVPKLVVGYDLARLIVGSEGTLAVVTAATLKLWPILNARRAAVATYSSSDAALSAVANLMAGKSEPESVEFLDEGCCGLARDAGADLPATVGALLMLSVAAEEDAQARAQLEQIRAALTGAGRLLEFIETDMQSPLWQARKVMSQKLKDVAAEKINEDVVVPVGQLAGLVKFMQSSCRDTGITNLNFGHAGVGNLHVNLLFDPADRKVAEIAQKIVADLMAEVVAKGGGISGEHGVGITKREFLPAQYDSSTLKLMRAIKQVFDPNQILNPGKPW